MTSQISFPKTGFITLIWMALVQLMAPSLFFSIKGDGNEEQVSSYIFEVILNVAFCLSLPVAGLYADIKFGRFKTVMFNLVLASLVTGLLTLMSAVVDKFQEATLIIHIALPVSVLSHKAFLIVNLLLGSDQLITATSQQLSRYVWFFTWSRYLGYLFTAFASCLISDTKYNFYITFFHLLCLLIVIISGCILKRYFIEYIPSKNPLKLTYNVLCFAKNNKYPVQRSALTYWEERYPSRIDLGKDKYGGPFSEEDVEDVKTLFQLLPIVAVITMVSFPALPVGRLAATTLTFSQCLFDSSYFIHYIVNVLVIPFYLFVKKHFDCRLTILKTIGLGIFMSTLSKVGFVAVDLYFSLQVKNLNQTCMFQDIQNLSDHNTYLHNSYIMVVPNLVGAFGSLFILTSSLEFVFAQAPHSMRGLLIGVYYGIGGLYELSGWTIVYILKYSNKYWMPSCEFYVFAVNGIVMLTSFLLFLILSKKYRLRSRGDIFNANVIAENYYENDFLRRQIYNEYERF